MRIVKPPNGLIDRFTRALVMTIPFDLAFAGLAPTDPSGVSFTGSLDSGSFTGSADSGSFTGSVDGGAFAGSR